MHICKKCGERFQRKRAVDNGLCGLCVFWLNVDVAGPDDCWLWTGKLDRCSYGEYSLLTSRGKRERPAHRVSWVIEHGEIPESLHVLHCCDDRYPVGDATNRRCVNPNHLRLGTHAENMLDCSKNRRFNPIRGDNHYTRTHPELKGSARGEDHGSKTCPGRLPCGDKHWARLRPELVLRGENSILSKLTERDVLLIRSSSETGISLASQLGVSRSLISRVRSGKSWKHLL